MLRELDREKWTEVLFPDDAAGRRFTLSSHALDVQNLGDRSANLVITRSYLARKAVTNAGRTSLMAFPETPFPTILESVPDETRESNYRIPSHFLTHIALSVPTAKRVTWPELGPVDGGAEFRMDVKRVQSTGLEITVMVHRGLLSPERYLQYRDMFLRLRDFFAGSAIVQ
jgi:hypothetical protein